MMKIILAGYVAIEATHKLITKEKPALSCRFSNRFLELTDEMTSVYTVSRDSIYEALEKANISADDANIKELSDMGIFGTLWELAEENNSGLRINLPDISVRQETIEIFEQLDINPYTYPSKGAWIIRAEKPYNVIDALEKLGIKASVIGHETHSNDRVIVNQDETRFLTPIDRLLKDEQGQKNYR